MNRKAQVTIFVIIALIIFVMGVLIYSFFPDIFASNQESSPIQTLIMNCLKKESKNVVFEIAERGGYFLTSKFSTEVGIPIYYEGSKKYIPPKEFVEEEIGKYLSQKMFFCTKNFIDFQEEYNISQGKVTAEVFISEDYIDFDLKYPLKIQRGDSTTTLKGFNLRIDSKFGIIYNSIVDFIEVSNGKNCLSCLLDISLRNDLYVDMFDGKENETTYIFKDKNNNPENKEVLRYVFAGKSN